MNIDAKVLKNEQNKLNNMLKGPYNTVKWYLVQGCKDDSTFTNQCGTTHEQSEGFKS